MKFVVILLLTTGGLEQIKYPIEKGLTCEKQVYQWMKTNVTYFDHTDIKDQGWYTKDNRLFVGHYCTN